MAYYLILDDDAPTSGIPLASGTMQRVVTSSPNLARIINTRVFIEKEVQSIDASDFIFAHFRSTDLADLSVQGNPLVPAAFYTA